MRKLNILAWIFGITLIGSGAFLAFHKEPIVQKQQPQSEELAGGITRTVIATQTKWLTDLIPSSGFNPSLGSSTLKVKKGWFTNLQANGTASASYGLFGQLQVAGFATASYSRFGTSATNHTNWISTPGDLFLSEDLDGWGSLSFGGPASLSNTLYVSTGGATGFVGIGTSVPASALHIMKDAAADLIISRASNDTGAPIIRFRKARGTHASSSDVANGDTLGTFQFQAYSGTGYLSGAAISSVVDGAFTSAQRPPSRLTFSTNIANTAAAERLRIDARGFVGIGLTTPRSLLELKDTVAGSVGSSSFAILSSDTVGAVASISAVSLTTGNALQFRVAASTSFLGRLISAVDNSTANRNLFVVKPNGDLATRGVINAGFGSVATVAYSRFGQSTTNHANYISDINDLLVSGDLDGKGSLSFAGFASLSNTAFFDATNKRLGIGTNTPNSPIQVSVTTGNFGTIRYDSGNTQGYVFAYDSDNSVNLGANSNSQVNFRVNNATVGSFNTSGNLGVNAGGAINTKLEIGGTASASYFLTLNTFQVGGGTASVAYNRIGSTATKHGNYISTTNDLLISGDLEVRGTASFGAVASISSLYGSLAWPAAAGTPSSVCENATTGQVVINAALTCTVSARDQKTDIKKLDISALSLTNALNPVSFYYKDNLKRQRWGFIAEDVQAVDPKLADAYDKNGNARSLDENALIALNTKAIQELDAKINKLEAEIKTLKSEHQQNPSNWFYNLLRFLHVI